MWDSPRSGLSCVNCAMSNSDADSADFVDEVGLGSAWYDPTAAAVSIIILNLNKSALTLQCLRQVWRHTEGHTYEIIVVDNGSKPEEFSKLADTPGLFKLIRLPVNRYFGEGNNIGVEASRGRYLVFLNNDAFVSKGWLEPLISTFENEPNVGGVGPRMVYPDGRLQEAGAFLDDVALSVQRGKFYRLTPWERETTMVVDYCSAACFLTTREIFDRVSGFDPIFEPAYYEDADLCFKIACLGLFVYYCPQVEIVHVESVTATDRDVAPILTGVIANNRDKFRARWQNYLSTREKTGIGSLPTLPPPRPRVADDAHHNLPLAVFHTPYDLTPGGGERYILTAASALRETHRVIIATEAPYSSYRLDYLEHQLGLNLSHIGLIATRDLPNYRNIELFFSMANFASPAIPPQGHRNYYMCQFPFPQSATAAARHWEWLRGYDAILVNSKFTQDRLLAKTNRFQFSLPIVVLPPPVPVTKFSTEPKPHGRTIIASVGRFFFGGHNKRQDILIEALRELLKRGHDCELHLAGTIVRGHADHYDQMVQKAEGLPIVFHPDASLEVINNVLLRASIYWHGKGYGVDPSLKPEICEPFGISVVEAMAAGCVPFVVSNGGPTEFVIEDETGLQYATINELVAKTAALLRSPERVACLSDAARKMAQQFSEEAFVQNWQKIALSRESIEWRGDLDSPDMGPRRSSRF